jgi:hypothetical protein
MSRKKEPVAATNLSKLEKVQTTERRPRGYIVRFPDQEAHLRAIMVLGEVELPYSGFPDPEYGVQYGLMNKHIEALEREEISFEGVF